MLPIQSCCSKLPCKAAPQSCSGSPKLLPKPAPQNCSPKPFPKLVIDSCSEQLLSPPKLFPKAASQSCFLKLIPKAVVLQSNCSSMLLQSRKAAPHSCSPKLLFKVATESRVPKKLTKIPKLLPEAASKLVRKAVQSCSPKLFPGTAPQSCAPKLFSKAVAPHAKCNRIQLHSNYGDYTCSYSCFLIKRFQGSKFKIHSLILEWKVQAHGLRFIV